MKPLVQDTAETMQMIDASEALLVALMDIARQRRVCPWCLLLHTHEAVGRAMEAGHIDHEFTPTEH